MSGQSINIENNTGVINIYSNDDKDSEDAESVKIAAVDKYSSPLDASIDLSKWGKEHYRISFLLKNALIDQVLQRNYITFKDKKNAKKMFKKISDFIYEMKKEAEEELKHSAMIIPKIWNKLSNLQKENEIDEPESKDLLNRTQYQGHFNSATPNGLLIHPVEEHFPSHNGSVKTASNKRSVYKISSYNNLNKKLQNINQIIREKKIKTEQMESIVQDLCLSINDNELNKSIKKEAMRNIKSLFTSDDDEQWIYSHPKQTLQACYATKMLYEIEGLIELDIDDYDYFIFDADKTIWNGPFAASTSPPYKKTENGYGVIDSQNNEIQLNKIVIDFIINIKEKGKKVGIITKSEKEGVEHQDQPVILILKELGLLPYFEDMIAISKDMPKSSLIPEDEERILFIDDNVDNLIDVSKKTKADAVNSNDFEEIIEDTIEPLEVVQMKEGESIEDFKNWASNNEMLFQLKDNYILKGKIKKESNNKFYGWKQSKKREYIPEDKKPEKPKNNKKYNLDHKKPLWQGGDDKKENLQWVPEKDHQNKTKEEGSYSEGGDKKQKKLKNEGKFKEYQKECGEAKQKKDRETLGEEGYSKQQSEIAKKRWRKK